MIRQEEFLNNYHDQQKIDFNGTRLGRLSCCDKLVIDDNKICQKCRQPVSIGLYPQKHTGDSVIWKVILLSAIGNTQIDILNCPLCNNPITNTDRICREGATCGGALCDVELIKQAGVWEVHRRIRQIRYKDTDLDPSVSIIERYSEQTGIKADTQTTEGQQNTPIDTIQPISQTPLTKTEIPRQKQPQPTLRNIPNDTDSRFITSKIIFKAGNFIPKTTVYDKYTDFSQRHLPDLLPLTRQAFYKLLATQMPDTTVRKRRINGRVERCFSDIDFVED